MASRALNCFSYASFVFYGCGYGKEQIYFSSGNDLLIDTSDPSNVTGAVPAFFSKLVEYLGNLYKTQLELEWVLTDSSQDTFTALYSGEVDSACGYWVPDGNWKQPTNLKVFSRPLAFSMMQCPTMYETGFVYTSLDAGLISYNDMVSKIQSTDSQFTICVAGKSEVSTTPMFSGIQNLTLYT